MADTVKKSRIVSDDDKDLGEALLEEFNIRLKNCMSQDDLQKESEPPEPDGIYENIPSPQKSSPKEHIADTENFLQTEIQENYYDEPKTLNAHQNGHGEVAGMIHDEEIYECIPEKTDNLDQNYVQMVEKKAEISQTVDFSTSKPQSQEYEPMGLEETTSNLYESVELKPQPTDISEQKKPILNLPTTCFTDYSEEISPDLEQKCSAKDRMLLSCDETSTLLFTQTVTSPMLTPSEENIDFLKGFQRENTISDSTASNSSPPKNLEDKFEATETSPDVSEPLEEEKVAPIENFYENTEFYKNTTPENMYENCIINRAGLASLTADEGVYEHLEVVKSEVEQLQKNEEKEEINDIYQNIEEVLASDTLQQKNGKSQDTDDGSLEEFIRNEREVSESFLINKNSKEQAQANMSENKKKYDIEEDVVDRVPHEIKIEEPPLVCDIKNDVKINESKDVESIQQISNATINHVVEETASCEDNVHPNPESNEIVQTITNTISTTATEETKEKISTETYKELIYHHKSESNSNYYEKYTEVLSKSSKNEIVSNREKDTETVPAEIVKNLKSQFQNKAEVVGIVRKGGGTKKETGVPEVKSANIINQIRNKFEGTVDNDDGMYVDDSTEYSETIVETNAPGERSIKKKKVKKTRKEEKENISVKSSFSKFDALQKKNVLHVRSSDSTKAQEKFSNGAQIELSTNCKACGKQVFQMEQIKAEKALWHKNCFRCTECSKQLTVDTYESNDGSLYCKPHFKALFAPKAVEEDTSPKPRRPELIIRENQPVELPPDVVRASDKPDLGLEELQSLNVKERFQVFEHYQTQHTESSETERGIANVKRSPSILSKLAKFQKHGMDVGVSNEALDGIPIEESESEEEEEEVLEGEDADLVRAKKVQKEKPFHFTGMSDVKKRWEQGDHAREERREETKQEIQNIRTRLFMGKQEKMKEAYQQAVIESESSSNLRKNLAEKIEACDTKSIKERWEKGEVANEKIDRENRNEEEEVYESEISKKSRSLFLELDASASKPPQISPVTPPKLEVKKARETETPEREIYRDPDVVRSEEYIDDSKIAKETHTASKMLNKFRQMEENLTKESEIQGPKPLKCFTPPPEPARVESRSDEEESSEYEEEEEEDIDQNGKVPEDLIEAQKAARAKQLRAKFEKWEANEIKKEQQNSVNIVEEFGEEQSQIESTRVLRAKFEQMRDTSTESPKSPRVKPNRFVEISATITETCQSCSDKVYPLEKISIHGNIYHKGCFKCMECSCVLRMDSYSYNQGLLYCTPHFKRLFISKGNYDSAFGLDQHKEKWQNNVNNMTVA